MNCPQFHHLRYDELLRPPGRRTSFEMDVGQCVHEVLDTVGKLVMAGHPSTRVVWNELLGSLRQATHKDGDPKYSEEVCDEAARLLDAYGKHWGYSNCGYPLGSRVVATEQTLVVESLKAAAIVDAIIELNGQLLAYDHKTVKRALPNFNLDLQLKTKCQYAIVAMAVRERYGRIPLVVHNEIKKTKEVGLSRVTLQYTGDELDQWGERLNQVRRHAYAVAPHRNTTRCVPGYPCDYLLYCWGSEEQRSRYKSKKE